MSIFRSVKKIFLFGCLFTMISNPISAQGDEQLWLDYQLDYPFANKYLLEANASYQTVLAKDRWRNVGLAPTFEYVLFTYLDLLSEVQFSYTLQKESINTFEISPMVGGRFNITQNKRISTRLLLRYQERNFYQIESKDWETSNRVRLKGEVWVTINGPNLFTDKLWYTFADYEEFFVLDEQLDERYANLRRVRLGVGYRLNYKNRFDLIYTWQSSRNEIEGDFVSNDSVIQLRYKMYLNPGKATQSD